MVVYSPWGCKSVKHNWATNTDIFKFSHNLFLVWCCEIVILCNENLLWAKLKEILLFNIIPTVINIFTLLWGWALFAGYLVQTIKTFNIGKGKTVQTVKRPVVARASGEGRGTSGWSPEDFQGWWEHSIRCLLFGTQGGPRRQKPSSMKGKQGTQRGFCTWEGAPPAQGSSCSASESACKWGQFVLLLFLHFYIGVWLVNSGVIFSGEQRRDSGTLLLFSHKSSPTLCDPMGCSTPS